MAAITVAFIVLGLVPLVLIAWLLTAATLAPSRLILTTAANWAVAVVAAAGSFAKDWGTTKNRRDRDGKSIVPITAIGTLMVSVNW
jgi:uncharacterized membrane protein YqjE